MSYLPVKELRLKNGIMSKWKLNCCHIYCGARNVLDGGMQSTT
jgi:hypothetical protein